MPVAIMDFMPEFNGLIFPSHNAVEHILLAYQYQYHRAYFCHSSWSLSNWCVLKRADMNRRPAGIKNDLNIQN